MKKLLLVLMAMVLWAGSSWGQTVTIGSGTNTGYLIPVNTNYGYTYSQQIVLQSEIGIVGQITKLRFYMVGGISLSSSNSWTVYLGHTSKASFASNTDWEPITNLTPVFSGIIGATPTAGWYEISLTGTFTYNNMSNLVVAVDENASGYNGASNYVRIWTTPVANRAIHYRSDGTNPDPASPPSASGRLAYINQMQFDIVGAPCSGIPEPGSTLSTSNPVCSGINFTLSLQNTTPGSGVTYQWQSSLTGAEPWTDLGTSATQVTSQTEATYYRCEVTCDGNTGASTEVQVTMNSWINCYCLPTYSSGGAGDVITQVTLGALSQATAGNVAPYYYNYTATQNAIPDLTQGFNSNLSLTFGSDGSQYNGVWIDFNHSGNFEATEFFTSNTNAGASGTVTVILPVPVDAELGNTRMRIRGGDDTQPISAQACGASSSGYGQAHDYLVNIIPATSPALVVDPLFLSFGSVVSGASSDEFSYTLTGLNLDPSVGEITITPPANFEVSTTMGGPYSSNPITAEYIGGSLNTIVYAVFKPTTSNASYSGNILNSGGNAADINVPVTGSSPLCAPVDQCNYTFRMTDGYGDGWNGNTMAVKQGGATVQTLAHTASGTAPVDVLVGLCDGISFELFWNTGGTYPEEVGIEILDAFGTSVYYKAPGSGAQSTTLYTGITNCTPPACAAPAALNVSNISTTGANLGWTSAESVFDIYVVPAGSPAPTAGSDPTADNKGNPFTWSGGTLNTQYDWYVRTDCEANGGTGQSDWTGPNTFTTACNAIDLPYTEGFESMSSTFNCWSVMGNTAALGGLNGSNLVPVSGNTWFVCTPASFTGAGATYIHSGIRSAGIGYTAPDFNWLVSSDLNMPASGSVNLKFWLWYLSNTSFTSNFYVNVFSEGVWSNVLTYNTIAQTNQFGSEVVVSLDAFAGKVIKVAFIFEYTDGYQMAVDDISIKAVPVATTWNGTVSSAWSVAGNWTPDLPGSITNVTIPSGLTNYPTLTASASCNNFTIQSGGSFIGSEFLTVNGTTTIERSIDAYTTGTDGWHLLSSPVAAQTVASGGFTGTPYDFYAWDEVGSSWLNQKVPANGITTFAPGHGYLVAYGATGTKTFSGAMNTAAVTLSGLTNSASSAYTGWHLAGNPFTSAINYETGAWVKTNLDVEMQVWNSATASYKTSAEVGGIIPAMNGFMVHTSGIGELTIPLSARTHSSVGWYKSSGEFILLKANDLDGNTSQSSLVRFNAAATEAFDSEFDSYFLTGFAPMFCSKSGNDAYALNTLPEVTGNLVIPFDFVKNSASNFNIELAKAIPGAVIYLTDKKTNTVTNLTANPVYQFVAVEGDVADRFLLHFGSVGIDNPANSQLSIYGYGDLIYIKGAVAGSEVKVTSLLGQVMINTLVNGDDVNALNARGLSNGIYLVSVINGSSIVSKKVVLNK